MKIETKPATLLLAVDFAGTFVFAVEGALAAAKGHLDLLGAMVLAFATALGGGIIRDVLIGANPPNSIRDWRYGVIAFLGAALVFLFSGPVQHIPRMLMLTLDAAGLSLFCVAGAEKALEYRIHPFIAILMGASPALAEERCATCCLPRCLPSCAPMYTQRRPWPEHW